MEALFKLNANEIDSTMIDSIKKLFAGKEVIIQVSSVSDDTAYLLSSKANKAHLVKSMASEPEKTFTEQEFDKHVKELISGNEKEID